MNLSHDGFLMKKEIFKISGLPSTLIQIKNNDILIKRKGAVKMK